MNSSRRHGSLSRKSSASFLRRALSLGRSSRSFNRRSRFQLTSCIQNRRLETRAGDDMSEHSKGAPKTEAEGKPEAIARVDWWGRSWFVFFAVVLVGGAGYFGYKQQTKEMTVTVVACLMVMALA